MFKFLPYMRTFFTILTTLLIVCGCKTEKDVSSPKPRTEAVQSLFDPALKPFYHGVASGDPLADRVVIWTRVTPEFMASEIFASWEISDRSDFSTIVQSGDVSTSPEKDYTIKVDVAGLRPGTTYYYRFKALEATSPTGRTKTLSQQPNQIQLAIVSCSNWEFGYFNAYGALAKNNLDAVIHLGDYIYEYGVGHYGDTTIGRKHLPPHEIVSLQDYRTRYSQYHLDKGLQAARQQHPFITIWDDHEVANNVYIAGAENHQDEEGDFTRRKQAAKQAYYEWLPIRESEQHYRAFSFGSLVNLVMLDERLEGRTEPVEHNAPGIRDASRSMLGEKQLVWFLNELKNSATQWKIIGNQVIFSEVNLQPVYPSMPRNMDSWDGYPAERERIVDHIRRNNLRNIIFITGDTHASWAIEASIDRDQKKNSAFAVELGTTSVSSGNGNEYRPSEEVMKKENALMKANPHIRYVNDRDHGYLLLTLTPKEAIAEWYYVNTLRQENPEAFVGKRFTINPGSAVLLPQE
jgi:alkaline phosphatase D